MEYKKILTEYQKLSDNLTKLFDNSDFINKCSENSQLSTLVWEQIAILMYFEKLLSDPKIIKTCSAKDKKILVDIKDLKNFKRLFDVYKQKTNSIKDLSEIKFKTFNDALDSINYLNVFLKNTYNVELSHFIEGKTVEKVVAEKVENQNTTNNYQSQQKNKFGNNFFGAGNFGFDPRQRVQDLQEMVYHQYANEKLQNDIISGVFYKFKTKPKIIPIIKIILSSLFILIALTSLLITIMGWVSNGLQYKGDDGKNITITNGANIFSTIMMVFYIFVYVWVLKILLKKSKNENEIYNIPKIILIIFMVFFLLEILAVVQTVPAYFSLIDKIKDPDLSVINPSFKINAFEGAVYTQIIQISVNGITCIVSLVGLLMLPKPDIERINLKFQEYVNEAKQSFPKNS